MSDRFHIILVAGAETLSLAAEQTALNIAQQRNAVVTVVDTLHRPSLSARWLTANSDDVFEMVVADKQKRLDHVVARFTDAGIDVTAKLLVGSSSQEITREAIERNADLVIRYMKGGMSRFPGLFGNTARNLMRISPTPLLLVGDRAIQNPRVLACVNVEHEDEENTAILKAAADIAGPDSQSLALSCWALYGGEVMRAHMLEEAYRRTLDETEQLYSELCDQFLKSHDLSAFPGGVRLENGNPVDVIPEVCRSEAIDIVVMSSASSNHPLRRLLGSTIESVMDQLPCALLVVKPTDFAKSVQIEQASRSVGA